MKAMILAAGRGSRLGDIGKNTPKCLMEAGGKTLLELAVERLKESGVNGLVINLHHLADQVENFVRSRGFFGIEVRFSYEHSLLDTGGGIKYARDFLIEDDYFLVHNADIYSEADLAALRQAHCERGALVTLAVRSCETRRYLLCDTDRIVGWVNDDTGVRHDAAKSSGAEKVTFTGIHAASREVFSWFEKEGDCFSIFTPYMKAVAAGKTLAVFDSSDSYWLDVGTPVRLEELRTRLTNVSHGG